MEKQHETDDQYLSQRRASEETAIIHKIPDLLARRPEVKGITIDGPTTQEIDDAFWIEKDPRGNGYYLFISIADIGSLITPQMTPTIEQEAFALSFTRYYSDHHQSMLPRTISENNGSLLEGQLRPTITISIPFTARYQPQEPQITLTTLCNKKRFCYSDVDASIDHAHTELDWVLSMAYVLAQHVFQLRRARGALAIYDLLTGWATTEDGILRQLGDEERFKARMIIQEFMILTNQTLALFFANHGIPALYRNHKATAVAPERSHLLELMDTAVTYPDRSSPERVRSTVNLAMERAYYAPGIEGHFGLNLPAYLHITSPLRRYADLVNQHILLSVLKEQPLPYSREKLEEIATHINQEEALLKEAKKASLLATHDQQLLAETMQNPTPLFLASLNTKKFHSLLRIAAQNNSLTPTLEQEIIRRLNENLLKDNDIFTLVFRFQNQGEAWASVKHACLATLQTQPYLATNIFIMGRLHRKWGKPEYKVIAQGPENARFFQARVSVIIEEQEYTSSLHTQLQHERAKQAACVEILGKIAGVDLAVSSIEKPDIIQTDPSFLQQPALLSSDRQNYKGQLLELARAHLWGEVIYSEKERCGPAHAPHFTVEGKITIDRQEWRATGIGSTKISAEQHAAQQLLLQIPESVQPLTPASNPEQKSAVSMVNELKQQAEIQTVTYQYEMFGPPHDREFVCVCQIITVDNQTLEATTTAKTKKESAQIAAEQVLYRFNKTKAMSGLNP